MKGIDVYNDHYKKGMDLSQVKAEGYDFNIPKLTEGVDFVDASAYEIASETKEADILLSYFHFATPGGSKTGSGTYKKWWDPIDEAHDFLEALEDVPAPDFRVALDFEWSMDHIEETLDGNLGLLTQWAEEWLTEVHKELGYWPIFYSYWSYIDSNILLPNAIINGCPLWLARYNGDTDPYMNEAWGWERWDIWQYTSSGSVEGINRRVDLNDAPYDLEGLMLVDCPPVGQEPYSSRIQRQVKKIRKNADELWLISKELEEKGL